jgi:hypothetical protein
MVRWDVEASLVKMVSSKANCTRRRTALVDGKDMSVAGGE